MRLQGTALTAGVAAAMLLVTGIAVAPAQAQVGMTDPDAAVACGAFQHSPSGAWTAIGPTVLNYNNGAILHIAPGQTFAPNHVTGGVEVTSTLDRHCGNM